MKTTEKISIGGFPFTIEQDAYQTLEQYINDISEAYSNDSASEEIIAAIEERIAELIMEKSGKDAVVTLATVNMVKERIGEPSVLADNGNADTAETAGTEQEKKPCNRKVAKRLYRDLDHRLAGGVCSGIAAYFNIDVIIPRLVVALLFLAGFITDGRFFVIAGIAYILLWVIIPPAKTVEEKCRLTGKPLGLYEFKERGESQRPLRQLGNDVRTSPALRTTGRVLGIIIGVMLMLDGITGIAGSLCSYIIGPGVIQHIASRHQDYGFNENAEFLIHFLSSNTVWLMITSVIAIFSLLLLYLGSLLTFNLKAPKWKPGLILFFIGFVVLIALAAHTARECLFFFV
ncbi:MAG: PspC domain-containing protein [Bacteroidales bacterium]|nr:PspC domain-containing protein [Bacteroidales bacterium]